MTKKIKSQKTVQFFVLFLLATIPFLFGAVHPIVSGGYCALIILILGGWLLFNATTFYSSQRKVLSPGILLFALFIALITLYCIPIPASWINVLSPVRALFLQTVPQLSGMKIPYAPLAYNVSSGILTVFFLIALFFYATTLKILLNSDRSFLKKILFTFITAGIIEALYGLIQATNPHLGVLWLTEINVGKGSARGTIIYKNQFAALLNMTWPIAVGTALLYFKAIPQQKNEFSQNGRHRRKHKKRKTGTEYTTTHRLYGFLHLFFTSIIMLAVTFSHSRGGIISMVIILLILLAILPINKKNKFFLGFLLFLLITSYGSIIGFNSILDRFMLIHESGQQRLDIWLSSLPMLRDHLLFGAGIGSYIYLSPIYLKGFPENIIFDRAHNDYLELGIELGLPLALFFLSAFLIIVIMLIKKIWPYTKKRLTKIPSPVIVSFVSSAGVIGFIIHGFVDFGWRLPANLLYITTLLVLLDHGSNYSSNHSRKQRIALCKE